jgi:hypothetical protein
VVTESIWQQAYRTEREVAYFAGFFDGEGCISLQRPSPSETPGSYSLTVSVGQSDIRPLERLKKVFGGSLHEVRRGPSFRFNWKTHWRWSGNRRVAQQFLEAARPYLIVKAEQCWLALEYLALLDRMGTQGHPTTPEQLAMKEGFYLALREAKR